MIVQFRDTKFTRVLAVVVVVLAFLLIGGAHLLVTLASPVNPKDTSEVTLVIPKGKGLVWLATELESKKLVRNALVFRLLGMKMGMTDRIQAGTYALSPSLSVDEIFTRLQTGTDDTWVTILEGWRKEEVAQELGRVLGDGFDQKAFLAEVKDREGYLYPDTYLFPKDISPSVVASYLDNTFKKRVTDEMLTDISKQGRTLSQVVTLASIIEREGNTKTSKEMISGILLNRLEIGMPLQVDASLQYAKGFDKATNSWWTPPFADDKAIKSPYNTYANAGLPPGPICSPGLDSIMAAIYPKENDNLYYITGNDGKMYYGKTIEEHNANVQKYLR